MLKWLRPSKDTGVRVARALSDGEVVDLSGVAFRVYGVPGHTNDERAAPMVSGAAQLIVVLESTPGAR